MFKTISEMKMKEERGFTLIELLIVIAILGILMAIAVPAYLGQREKAKVRAVGAGGKGAVTEIQGYLDSLVAGDPFIILDSAGDQQCLELGTPGAGKTCLAVYNLTSGGTYVATAENIVDLLTLHHQGKNEKSPFNSSNYLFIDSTGGVEGTVAIGSAGTRTIRVMAFGSNTDTADALLDTNVTAK